MTAKLLAALKQGITGLRLVPASGGCFELTVDGDLVYSKLATGSFPDEQWVVEQLRTRSRPK